MKTPVRWFGILLLLGLLAGALAWSYQRHRESPHEEAVVDEAAAARHEAGVKLETETQTRIGLVVAHPTPFELAPEIEAFGHVLDPSPLAALGAELATAEAALATSRATAERERLLFSQQQNISRKVLETSEAQLRSDETKVRALQRRLHLEWGEEVARIEPSPREKLLDALVSGDVVIVRVDVSAGERLARNPEAATVHLLGQEDEIFSVKSLSATGMVDPKTQAQGFHLVIVHPSQALRPGAAVVARLELPGDKLKGFLIERSAVVRHEGQGWVYVKTGPEEFERRELSLEHATSRGWFLETGFQAQDEIVVTGAQSLLSEELKSKMAED